VRRLTYERRHRRLPQRLVAAATHVPQPDLSQIEIGRLVPTRQQLQRLSAFYGVPPDDLLKDVAIR
jgi:transcriptional regulator with XRE-family HTH domain